MPENSGTRIHVKTIDNLQLFSTSEREKIRLTPIVQILPARSSSQLKEPMIIELMTTTMLVDQFKNAKAILMYNSGSSSVPRNWEQIELDKCQVQKDRVSFEATSFGCFAVVAQLWNPTASVLLEPNCESDSLTELKLEEVPGFRMQIPSNVVDSNTAVKVKATAYYSDPIAHLEDNKTTIASPCISLEPHGIKLSKKIAVTFPIPDFEEINKQYPGIKLQLWHNPGPADSLEDWHLIQEHVEIQKDSTNTYTGTILVSNFSSEELRWNQYVPKVGRKILSYFLPAQRVKRRCQVFMTKIKELPIRTGNMISFGIQVKIVPFVNDRPRTKPPGYSYELLDTGEEPIEFSDNGSFTTQVQFSDNLFSTALAEKLQQRKTSRLPENLNEVRGVDFLFELPYVELGDGGVLGQLRVSQQSDVCIDNRNLIKVYYSYYYSYIASFL